MTTNINAIEDRKFEEYLSNLGVLEKVKAGECTCAICGSQITYNNIAAVYPCNGKICFVCDSLECIAAFRMGNSEK